MPSTLFMGRDGTEGNILCEAGLAVDSRIGLEQAICSFPDSAQTGLSPPGGEYEQHADGHNNKRPDNAPPPPPEEIEIS